MKYIEYEKGLQDSPKDEIELTTLEDEQDNNSSPDTFKFKPSPVLFDDP